MGNQQSNDKLDADKLKVILELVKHRTSLFWSITTKTSTLCFAIIFVPFIYEALEINTGNLPLWLFPAIGFFLSLINVIFMSIEMHNIKRYIKIIDESWFIEIMNRPRS